MSSPSPKGDTGVEVIDPELHSPTGIAARVVMNASDGEQQGIHAHVVQQQRRRRISFSPQSKLEDDQIARMIEEDIVSKQNPGFLFPRYGKLQLRKAQRDDTPNLAEVSPLDVCSASTIPPKGMDGHNNLVQTLLSYYNSLDISQTVGPQAYDELKACLQDEF
ncbi:hypothetical protein E2562_008387 [Oryza meyeriana var. granulata]|uniref:Uncharacterized protein n=1 Tax=Oryza meyeriana var. granulata TaxID=110450 RepID=A0A6G1EH28_9ORYZ|nr:hypothetical protein E2562_008387 [Oryza meyeriana var. granulata]